MQTFNSSLSLAMHRHIHAARDELAICHPACPMRPHCEAGLQHLLELANRSVEPITETRH